MMRKSALGILFISLLLLASCFARDTIAWHMQGITPARQNNVHTTHILGGFSLDTPDRATKAAANGIQVAFQYGQPPTRQDTLGQQLQLLHIKVIDGYIADELAYYECHRTKTVAPPPSVDEQFCQHDSHPYLTNENVLLAAIATHLKQEQGNQLIIGYWVLDDWAPWDEGSARSILVKIHQLIQQYTPSRLAICGFGASLYSTPISGWDDETADNFSPQACDMVGLYIYASSQANSKPMPSLNAYDWSMSALLPTIFTSLRLRGWNITKEPLMGISQAFGGSRAHTNTYRVIPNAKSIEMQSKSFCQHGATSLTYYAWNDSSFAPDTQTPLNNIGIQNGIHNGIAACQRYWT